MGVPGSVSGYSLLYSMAELATAMERMYCYASRTRRFRTGFVDKKHLISVCRSAVDVMVVRRASWSCSDWLFERDVRPLEMLCRDELPNAWYGYSNHHKRDLWLLAHAC